MRSRPGHPKPRRRGITLILAILIMSSVVAIGITSTTIVITQVRINEVTTSSHQGYYAAESGLEQGLNKVITLKSNKTIDEASTELANLVLPGSTLIAKENQAFFPAGDEKLSQTTASTSAQAIPATLKENQSAYLEIYNVDNSIAVLPSTAPVLCLYAESADGANDEVLEVTWVAWDTNLEISRSQRVEVSSTALGSTSTCAADGYPVPLNQFFPAFNPSSGQLAGYRLRITAMKPTAENTNGDVKNVAVYLDQDPVASGIQTPRSQIQLKSVSSGKGQKQALVATFPWTLPLSSAFDFVIFSERSLQKKIALSVSQEVKTYGPYQVEDGINSSAPPLYSSSPCAGPPYSWWCNLWGNSNPYGYCSDPGGDPANCSSKGWTGVHCQADAQSTGAYCDGNGSGGTNQWLNPDASVMSTQSLDYRCWQLFDQAPPSYPTPIGAICGFYQYAGSGTHKISVPVPTAAFADCTTGPCNYYVRLRGKLSRTMYVNMVESGPTTSSPPTFYYDYENRTTDYASQQLTLKDQVVQPADGGAVSSCILPSPFIVNNKDANHFLTFRNLASNDPVQSGGFGTCASNSSVSCDTNADCTSYPPNTTCNINRDTAPSIDSYDILTQPSFIGPEEGFCPQS